MIIRGRHLLLLLSGLVLAAGCSKVSPPSEAALAKTSIEKADLFRDKGEWDKALAAYHEAIRLDPRSVPGYKGRAAVWMRMGLPDRAIVDLDEVIHLSPSDAEAYSTRGTAWMLRGEVGMGYQDWNEAARLDPRVRTGIY